LFQPTTTKLVAAEADREKRIPVISKRKELPKNHPHRCRRILCANGAFIFLILPSAESEFTEFLERRMMGCKYISGFSHFAQQFVSLGYRLVDNVIDRVPQLQNCGGHVKQKILFAFLPYRRTLWT